MSKVRACVCGVPNTKDSVAVPKHLAQLPATSRPSNSIPFFQPSSRAYVDCLHAVATVESFGSKQLHGHTGHEDKNTYLFDLNELGFGNSVGSILATKDAFLTEKQ